MTGGEAYRAKLITDNALDAGKGSIDVAAAVLAHRWSADELAVEDATPARLRNAVRTAVLLAVHA